MAKNTVNLTEEEQRTNAASQAFNQSQKREFDAPIITEAGSGAVTPPPEDPYVDPGAPKKEKSLEELEKEQFEIEYSQGIGAIDKEFRKQAFFNEKLGLSDKNDPKTITEFVQSEKDKRRKQREFQDQQLSLQQRIATEDLAFAENQITSQKAGVTAAFAQGREGAMSGSAPSAAAEFKSVLDFQLKQRGRRYALAMSEIDAARNQLKEAERRGDESMAAQLRGQIQAASNNAMAAQTDYLNALDKSYARNQQQQVIDRQNFESFANLVDSGAEMTTDGIISMAQQLGVPFESAHAYYESAKRVREDKNLSLEEKQLRLNDLAFNLELEQQGIRGEQAKSAALILDQLRAGKIDMNVAQELLVNAEIPSFLNPITQLQQKKEATNLRILEIGAQYLDREKAQALRRGEQDLQ